jgi:DNA-directed RNA polymerase subunit RPC12/RpoP
MSESQTFTELILSEQTDHIHSWHIWILKYCNMNWPIQFETETSTYLDRFLWLENIKKTEAIYANKMSAATEVRCPQCNSLYVAPSPENKDRLECKECGTLF